MSMQAIKTIALVAIRVFVAGFVVYLLGKRQ